MLFAIKNDSPSRKIKAWMSAHTQKRSKNFFTSLRSVLRWTQFFKKIREEYQFEVREKLFSSNFILRFAGITFVMLYDTCF